MKKFAVSVLLLSLACPTSSWAESDATQLQVLVCQTDTELLTFSFLQSSDGTLSLIGDPDATVSKSANAVTVLEGDKVHQFQDNRLQTLEGGTLKSSDCSDMTETIAQLVNLIGEADTDASVSPSAIVPATAQTTVTGLAMTGPELENFRIAVNRCWNVEPGSVAARVTVEVGFTLTREGRITGEPRLLSSNGDPAATATAFEAARRAILRCQNGGYQLPPDKFVQWQETTMTFDVTGLRLRQ